MCKASELSSAISDLIGEAFKTRRELKEELSRLDKTISDIHHDLELAEVNKEQAAKVTIYIQKINRERRKIKRELYSLDLFITEIDADKLRNRFESLIVKTRKEYNNKVKKRGVLNQIIK